MQRLKGLIAGGALLTSALTGCETDSEKLEACPVHWEAIAPEVTNQALIQSRMAAIGARAVSDDQDISNAVIESFSDKSIFELVERNNADEPNELFCEGWTGKVYLNRHGAFLLSVAADDKRENGVANQVKDIITEVRP